MTAADDARREHFDSLTRSEQEAAIRRMAADGASEYGISAATGLSVEMVRRILGERDHAE
jgi:hypothetical protein